jgi:crescentin
MSKLSGLFGRGGRSGADKPASAPKGQPDTTRQPAPDTFSDVGSRIGEENEALRNLLFDTGRKINELDELKSAFDKIVTPFNNTLRALEQEKSQNLSLSGQLDESRAAYDKLRADVYQVERRATFLESENARLREDLELARETARGLESHRNDIQSQISAQHAQLSELERQLAQESNERRTLSENKRTLTEHLEATEKRTVTLEGDLAAARERVALLDTAQQTAKSSLDQALDEISRITRRLTESENTLAATRTQLAKVEATHAETSAERTRLATTLDETKEAHQTERNSLNARLDGLQSRAATAERLLAEARQNLVARTEEVRSFDRKAVEATIARNNADKRLAQIEATHETRERQIKDLEQSRAALVERTNALTKTLKTREAALARAEERNQALTDRAARLEGDIQVSRTNIEKRVEDLNSSLQRERMERAVVEGALEAARKDNSRLQSEVAALRAALRRGAPLDAPAAEDAPKPARKAKGSAENVEPIVKS